jgi:RNA polymerase sigma factor (sigma-70 family)
MRILGNVVLAQDAVAEIFLRVLARLRQAENGDKEPLDNPKWYLWRIALPVILDVKQGDGLGLDELHDEIDYGQLNRQDTDEAEAGLSLFREAGLTAEEEQVMYLRYVEGRSVAAVAEIMGINERRVVRRTKSACEKLIRYRSG